MNQGPGVPTNTVLFVDDEEMAQKYFRKAYQKNYDVLTASSVDEAWAIIEERNGDLAILVTDQRMPNRPGVELLRLAREKYPKIIRILTTAYTELDSAIEAVNRGAIYQYVVKPWDITELGMTLKRAMDLYQLQFERDMLLQAKLSVLQRLVVTDRVQNLAVLSVGLGRQMANTMSALSAYLECVPESILQDRADSALSSKGALFDLDEFARTQSRTVLSLSQDLADVIGIPAEQGFCRYQIGDALANGNASCTVSNDVPAIVGDESMVHMAVDNLCRHLGDGAKVEVSNGSNGGVAVSIEAAGSDKGVADCFALLTDREDLSFSIAVLAVFYVASHHGGNANVGHNAQNSLAITLNLPADVGSDVADVETESCTEQITRHFAAWDAAL